MVKQRHSEYKIDIGHSTTSIQFIDYKFVLICFLTVALLTVKIYLSIKMTGIKTFIISFGIMNGN